MTDLRNGSKYDADVIPYYERRCFDPCSDAGKPPCVTPRPNVQCRETCSYRYSSNAPPPPVCRRPPPCLKRPNCNSRCPAQENVCRRDTRFDDWKPSKSDNVTPAPRRTCRRSSTQYVECPQYSQDQNYAENDQGRPLIRANTYTVFACPFAQEGYEEDRNSYGRRDQRPISGDDQYSTYSKEEKRDEPVEDPFATAQNEVKDEPLPPPEERRDRKEPEEAKKGGCFRCCKKKKKGPATTFEDDKNARKQAPPPVEEAEPEPDRLSRYDEEPQTAEPRRQEPVSGLVPVDDDYDEIRAKCVCTEIYDTALVAPRGTKIVRPTCPCPTDETNDSNCICTNPSGVPDTNGEIYQTICPCPTGNRDCPCTNLVSSTGYQLAQYRKALMAQCCRPKKSRKRSPEVVALYSSETNANRRNYKSRSSMMSSEMAATALDDDRSHRSRTVAEDTRSLKEDTRSLRSQNRAANTDEDRVSRASGRELGAVGSRANSSPNSRERPKRLVCTNPKRYRSVPPCMRGGDARPSPQVMVCVKNTTSTDLRSTKKSPVSCQCSKPRVCSACDLESDFCYDSVSCKSIPDLPKQRRDSKCCKMIQSIKPPPPPPPKRYVRRQDHGSKGGNCIPFCPTLLRYGKPCATVFQSAPKKHCNSPICPRNLYRRKKADKSVSSHNLDEDKITVVQVVLHTPKGSQAGSKEELIKETVLDSHGGIMKDTTSHRSVLDKIKSLERPEVEVRVPQSHSMYSKAVSEKHSKISAPSYAVQPNKQGSKETLTITVKTAEMDSKNVDFPKRQNMLDTVSVTMSKHSRAPSVQSEEIKPSRMIDVGSVTEASTDCRDRCPACLHRPQVKYICACDKATLTDEFVLMLSSESVCRCAPNIPPPRTYAAPSPKLTFDCECNT